MGKVGIIVSFDSDSAFTNETGVPLSWPSALTDKVVDETYRKIQGDNVTVAIVEVV